MPVQCILYHMRENAYIDCLHRGGYSTDKLSISPVGMVTANSITAVTDHQPELIVVLLSIAHIFLIRRDAVLCFVNRRSSSLQT